VSEHSERAAYSTEASVESSQTTDDRIPGDRGIPSVNRVRSLQARVSNALAMALMAGLGVGMLTWYYAHAVDRQKKARVTAQSTVKGKAQAEMVLPALGRIDSPVLDQLLGPAPALPEHADSFPLGLQGQEEPLVEMNGARSAVPESVPAAVDPVLVRQLKGSPFVAANDVGSRDSRTALADAGAEQTALAAASDAELGALLRPTILKAAVPSVLGTQRLLLPKGAFIDCTLETALDSSVPGMTTCITATDTFSADGTVVLIERGTKLVGETRGSVRQGATRIFVLWSEARTPDGLIVPLASAGTDELGRAGLPGEVDRHFLERFGAALLISVIDGAIEAAVQPKGDGTVIYNPSSTQDIVTEVLRSTVNIPPTVRKRQGDRIQIFVARDIDFRSVYQLRAESPGDARERG
jgi:type IV secretion system protein VirB10